MATNASAGMTYYIRSDASQHIAESAKVVKANEAMALSLAKIGIVRDTLMRGFKSVGLAAVTGAGAIAAMGVGTGMLIAEVQEFDASLKRVAALGGPEFAANIESIIRLSTEMGATWGVASDDIAKGMIELVKTGFTYVEVMEMIESITQAAVTNQMAFADIAGIAASATLLFTDSGYSTAEMLEILHTAAAKARLDMEDVDTILGYVGSSAVIAGLSIEEMSAFMGALSNAAFASQQSVRTMIAHLVNKAPEIEAKLGSIGISLKVIGEDGTLALGEIINAMNSGALTLEDWAEIWKIIGIRSGQALTVGSVMAESYNEILEDLGPNTDNLKSAAEVMAMSLPAMWTKLAETFHQAIYTEEYMDNLRGVMQSLINVVQELGPDLQKLITIMITGFRDNLPIILDLLKLLVETGQEFLPTMMAYVRVFGFILELLKALGPAGLSVVIHFMLLNKIFGLTTISMQMFSLRAKALTTDLTAQAIAINRLQMGAMGLQLALGAAFTIMMAVTAQSEEERMAFIALAAVTWGLVGVQIALAVAKTGAQTTVLSPFLIPVVVAAIGAGIAYAMSIPASAGYEYGTPYVPETGMYLLHRGEAVTTAADNRQYSGIHGGEFSFHFYDSGAEDMDYVMSKYGK